MPTQSRAPRSHGGPASMACAVAGVAMVVLLVGFTGGAVMAADPDFSSVSDILGGQRHLLRDDDLVIGQLGGFQRAVLRTKALRIANQEIAAVASATCGASVPQPTPFQTRVGRLFDLDHDVVVSVAPLAAAGPGCSGNPNLALYVQDPQNPANDSQTALTISPGHVQIALADFNADGRADVLLLNDQFAIIYTAVDPENPARGLVEVAQLGTAAKLAPQDNLVTGDFNGDGALDAAWPTATVADGIGTNWTVQFVSVCPAAGAIVLGQTCAAAFQIILSTQTIGVGSDDDIVFSVTLTTGNYDGALASASLPLSRLLIAWNSLGNSSVDVLAVYSFDSMLAPTQRSTLTSPTGPTRPRFCSISRSLPPAAWDGSGRTTKPCSPAPRRASCRWSRSTRTWS